MPTTAEYNIDLQESIADSHKKSPSLLSRHDIKAREIAIASATLLVIVGVYLLRVDGVVGQFKDDAWYVILAKSLATGNGYNLINLPQRSGFYFYPPFFPFLLSLLYRMSPKFPSNVLLLKSLSIASMLVLPFLVFRLLNREDRLPKSLAYLVAFASALVPSLVMAATSSIMSECVFTTLQFATLLYADHCRREARHRASGRTVLTTGVLVSASILTRTIGIALIPAIALDFLKQRILRSLAIFLISAAVCLAPWLVYKHLRTSHASGPVMPGYSSQFWDRLAGSYSGVKVTARDLPARVWQISTVLIGDDVGAMIAPSLYRFPSESGREVMDMTAVISKVSRNAIGLPGGTMGLNVSAQIISLCFSIVVLIGFVCAAKRYTGAIELFFVFTLAMIVIWPWTPTRFLGPLAPLLFYYLLLGIMAIYRAILKRLGRASFHDVWGLSRVVMLCLLGLLLYDNAGYIMAKNKDISSLQYPDWVRQFEANRQAAEWIREHVPESEVVAGGNPPFIYLFSDRQTDMCMPPQCAKMGIRYYLRTGDEEVSVPASPVFIPNYHGIAVLDLQHK